MYKPKNFAFTLVELIVVIVILAILATISFLSFSSYSLKSRDSVRLADMNNISKGLLLYYTKSGTYPIPDNSITITASGTNIGYQGYAGLKTLGIINLSNGGKDPLDNIYYTYNTNTNQNKYQLLGYLEDSTSISFNTNNYNNIYADSSDYSKRFYYTKGDSLGVIVNSGTNTPIQYNNTNSGFELTTATGGNQIIYVDKNNILQGTGFITYKTIFYYFTTQASSTYPGCNVPDIKVPNGQIWAACNVGASSAFTGIDVPAICFSTSCSSDVYLSSRNMLGSYFQWGRNDDVTNGAAILTQYSGSLNNLSTGNNNWYAGTNTTYSDWYVADINNPSPARWNVLGGGNNQGPCASGYHVPTTNSIDSDWYRLSQSLVGTISPSGVQMEIIRQTLMLPLAGYREWGDGAYWSQGHKGIYGSSTPDYQVNFIYGGGAGLKANLSRARGFSVRCIKN